MQARFASAVFHLQLHPTMGSWISVNVPHMQNLCILIGQVHLLGVVWRVN